MRPRTVDLAAPMNETREWGHPADFPVTLKPLFYRENGVFKEVRNRLAVLREDTREPLAVVSDRYTLVPHQRLLDLVDRATRHLDVGPVPRGIYVDRRGARMRALFKFPALARPVLQGDPICPCIKIQNTYDATSRVTVHIGAFRFVCTNLAVGGGGVFAGGFMAVHQGTIPVEEIAHQLGSYLAGFDRIVDLYRAWALQPIRWDRIGRILEPLPKRTAGALRDGILRSPSQTVYAAYNVATRHATHRMRSYRSAFDLLERINRGFQEEFPPPQS